jgi:hypothetical protein
LKNRKRKISNLQLDFTRLFGLNGIAFYAHLMSNKHVNHKHGLTTMNATRPKSKIFKRNNKAKAKVRKAVLLTALADAVKAHA